MSGWRPIRTAPKDGTVVDLWFVYEGIGLRRVDAAWYNGHWCWAVRGKTSTLSNCEPTHWMPVPQGPA